MWAWIIWIRFWIWIIAAATLYLHKQRDRTGLEPGQPPPALRLQRARLLPEVLGLHPGPGKGPLRAGVDVAHAVRSAAAATGAFD